MSAPAEHDVVGWRFRAFGAIYRCTRYDPALGYWMTLLEPGPDDDLTSARYTPGWQTCVSERAPGRTYHRIFSDESPEPHGAGCKCYVCMPRSEL